jgi:hypothetical protein
MMGYGYGNMMGLTGFFAIVTWIALIVFLTLGSVYFWREIRRKDGR